MRDHPDTAEHVAECDDCQARLALSHAALDVDLERTWTGVAAEAWTSQRSWPERVAARLLDSAALARALATTPSLFLSWILASAAVLAAGVLATPLSGDPWAALVAPALAGAGIAYAYGPGVDPAFELTSTTATSGRMILLARSLTVFALNAALGLLASVFAAAMVGITVGWLLPMTTVSALALAAATLSRSANVGVLISLGAWGMVILAAQARTGDYAAAVNADALMPFYAAATAALVALILYSVYAKREESAWR
jgi:hypothetical protein